MHFTIPVPPSVNVMYRNVRGVGRVKTERYRTWLRAASNELVVYKSRLVNRGKYPLALPVRVSIEVPRTDNRRQDIDNRIKAVADLLVHAGVLVDDSYIAEVRAAWKFAAHERDRVCHVEITELTAPEDWRRVGKKAQEV